VILTYRYRLLPLKSQHRVLERLCVSMLDYKAEKAGGHLVRVDPRNTSQKCSGCGELVAKSLAVRTHACPSCALVIDRDHNASLNILRAGIGAGALNVIGLR
jgi:putative transposase